MAVPYFLQTSGILASGGLSEVFITEENATQNRWTYGSSTGLVSKSSTVNLYDIVALINGNSTGQQKDPWLFNIDEFAVFNNGMVIEKFDDITLVNNGVIAGRGGNGGSQGGNGSVGNSAVKLQGSTLGNVTINNKLDGYLIGGGGGGRGSYINATFAITAYFFNLAGGGGGGWNGGNGGSARINSLTNWGTNGNKYGPNSYGVGGYGPVSGGTGVTFTSRNSTYQGGVPSNSAARYSHDPSIFGPASLSRFTAAPPASEGGGNGGGAVCSMRGTSSSVFRDIACQAMPGCGGGATPVFSMPSQGTRSPLTSVYWYVHRLESAGAINQGSASLAGLSYRWAGSIGGGAAGGGGGRGGAGAGSNSVPVASGNSVEIVSGSSPNLVYVDEPGDTGNYYGTRDF